MFYLHQFQTAKIQLILSIQILQNIQLQTFHLFVFQNLENNTILLLLFNLNYLLMLDQLNQSVEISQKINQIQLYFSMLNLQALNKICDRLYDKINIFHYLNYNLFNYF